MPSPIELPDAVKHFDNLPDEARLNSRDFMTLLRISSTTFWRRRKEGVIPQPDRFGTWTVGEVRKVLSAR